MTAGKNPRNFRKKGMKKRLVHPFARKEWYEVRAPIMFEKRSCSLTPVTKTMGTKIASDGLKGRVFEISLSDLCMNAPADKGWRKIKLCVEEVQGRSCLTTFHGMSMTRDKLCSLVRKWQTLIEAFVDVKTLDGYFLRIFCIGFTSRVQRQVKATSYAKRSKTKNIRQKMMEIIIQNAQKHSLKDLVKKFIDEEIEKTIAAQCAPIYPLQNVIIRKVKVLKKVKFDSAKISELYGEQAEREAASRFTKEGEGGEETEEPKNLLAE